MLYILSLQYTALQILAAFTALPQPQPQPHCPQTPIFISSIQQELQTLCSFSLCFNLETVTRQSAGEVVGSPHWFPLIQRSILCCLLSNLKTVLNSICEFLL